MHLQDLPASRPVAVAHDENLVASALCLIFKDRRISHYDIIQGAPCSGRIFYTRATDTSAPLPDSSPNEVAKDLMKLCSEARFPTRSHEEQGDLFRPQKGWEIRESVVGNLPVAIAFATYVKKDEREILNAL